MSNNSAEPRSTHWPAWLYFTAVMLAYAVVIFSAKAPPHFVDYPDWVYQGVLFQRVVAGHPVPGYTLKSYPVPNSLTTVGLGLLDTFLPWQFAAKLWVCLYLLLAGASTFLLSRALPRVDGRMIVAIPAILFLNLDFWYGHISFEIGICLFLILVALTLRGGAAFSITLFLVLIFFAHMEALACAILFIALWSAFTRRWRWLWTTVPAVALSAWYAAARFAGGNSDAGAISTPPYRYASKSFLLYKANTFFKSFGYVNARSLRGLSLSEAVFGRAFFVVLAALSVVTALLVLIAILRATLLRKNQSPPSLRALILALIALAVFLPQIILGTADPGSRLLLTAALLGFYLVDWRSRTGAAIVALSVLFCAANLWQFARIEHNPNLQPHRADLAAPLLTYGHVEPLMRDSYYQHLSAGEMNMKIFPTGIFVHHR